MLGVDPPQSLDQVIDPSWLTAAVGASTRVPEGSEREGLLAEIKTLTAPAFDRRAIEAWNHLATSAGKLLRARRWAEAKRLYDTGWGERGHCPLCGQTVDDKSLAREIERARGGDGGVTRSRALPGPCRPAGGRSRAPTPGVSRFTIAPDRSDLELPPPPDLPLAALRSHVEALASIDVEEITRAVSEIRKWDRSAGAAARKVSPPKPSTRDTQLVMLAALCQQVNAWRVAEQKAVRARRALDLAERVFDAYQEKQKKDLSELLKRISRRVAQIYSALHPGEDLDSVSIEPWTAKGLELAIEFYGSHQRPPHGVLSEST